MSMYDDQPDTQGTDPLDAELGEDGQGDLAPEDLPHHRSDDIGASIINEDQALGGPMLPPDTGATPPPGGGSYDDDDDLGGSDFEQGMDPAHTTDGWIADDTIDEEREDQQ